MLLLLMGCRSTDAVQSVYAAFSGGTIIDGTGSTPIENGVLLIQDGRVVAVGPRHTVSIPEGATVIDVTGKTIMPGIINGHGHVGNTRGIEGGHYSRENVIDNLEIYARDGHCLFRRVAADDLSGDE